MARHGDSVPERSVDPSNTYDPVTSFSVTECSADRNGFFGMVASETRYLVKYRYGLEITPDADPSEVLYAVEKTIQAILLSTYFPTVCTDDRSAKTTGITGFRFDPSDDETVGK